MSNRSKIVYLLLALLFVFTSLAGSAFAAVQMAAVDFNQSDIGFHLDGSLDGPSSIAGRCDMAGPCGGGSG